VAALRRLRAAGWRLVMVTGRNLDDVGGAFPDLGLFDSVVAENGAVVVGGGRCVLLGPEPSRPLLDALERRAVPYSTGRVVVHTLAAERERVAEAAAESGADVEISLNKGALMLLPRGVDKAAGLRAALADLGVDPAAAVGVGDAENDLSFLRICGRAYACGEALPEVRATAGRYTSSVGDLVVELLGG
jgi:hydroxymethylpyrimidine pyrophosphatase-like HAD family hydrolase